MPSLRPWLVKLGSFVVVVVVVVVVGVVIVQAVEADDEAIVLETPSLPEPVVPEAGS